MKNVTKIIISYTHVYNLLLIWIISTFNRACIKISNKIILRLALSHIITTQDKTMTQ